MGDRGNIVVKAEEERPPVVFYTHWGGSQIAEFAAKAIARNQRWDDPAYLARIVFCTMIEGDVTGETGFGIAVDSLCDNEHPIVTVNVPAQRLEVSREYGGPVVASVSFNEHGEFQRVFDEIDG